MLNFLNIRSTAATLLIIMVSAIAYAQNTFEGEIKYAISYEELPTEMAAMESMLPKEMLFHIKGDKIALVQDMMGGKQTVVSDSKTNESFIMMNMMGQKIAITMTKEEIEEAMNEAGDADIKYIDETKEIAGYKCRKATISNEGNTIEVWYTKDIVGAMHSEFKTLDGFPLEYFSYQEGMKMKISATTVTKGSQPANLFIIPEGYTKMTMAEFSSAMGMGGTY
jgi:uncharacterized glyoxalase superfamily protein PhnB